MCVRKGKGGKEAGEGGMKILERRALSVHKWSKCLRYTCRLVSANTNRLWAVGDGLLLKSRFVYRWPARGCRQAA